MDFDFENVPLICDFFLTLREEEEGGLHIELMSESQGHLAGFPAWDHADRDLRHFTHDDIPLGDEEEPFADADEGWRIVIFARGNEVFVLEGDSPRGPPPAPVPHPQRALPGGLGHADPPLPRRDVAGGCDGRG